MIAAGRWRLTPRGYPRRRAARMGGPGRRRARLPWAGRKTAGPRTEPGRGTRRAAWLLMVARAMAALASTAALSRSRRVRAVWRKREMIFEGLRRLPADQACATGTDAIHVTHARFWS